MKNASYRSLCFFLEYYMDMFSHLSCGQFSFGQCEHFEHNHMIDPYEMWQ